MIISDTSIKQPVFVSMLMLLTVVLGLLAYNRMPVNLLPDIDIPIVSVSVAYPGAGPATVADQVAQPLEDEVITISGVTNVTSNSTEGLAVIVIEFVQERDPALALQDVRESVTAIRAQLPEEINEPVFQRFDPAQTPILTLAITSRESMEGERLRRLVDDEIVPRIQRVPGVGSTTLTGGRIRQINVQLDLKKLTVLRILPSQVSNAIRQDNIDLGMGKALFEEEEVNLRAPSTIERPADIAAVGIPRTEYTVGDVATIEDGLAELSTYSRLNGRDAISLDIRKQTGTNTVEVAESALMAVEEAFAQFPELSYVVIRNDAEQVRESVSGAINEIVVAVVFASLVVLAFFRDLRNTLVTVIGLPVIIIGTFAAMQLFGLTINILTLLALSISVGLVIDDAIVVRENIFRHMEMGETPREAASRGTAEVATSVLAMTLTLVAVFLPVTFTSGTTGIIFQAFGITVACATIISLFEAFTLAPAVSAYWFKQKQPSEQAQESPETADETDYEDEETSTADEDQEAAPAAESPARQEESHGWMERIYRPILNWALDHRAITVGIGLLVMVASVLAATTLKFAFLPESDANELGVAFELPPGTPLDVTNQRAQEAEAILLDDPAVQNILATVGGGGDQAAGLIIGGGGGSERATFLVQLTEDAVIEDTRSRLRDKLSAFPNLVLIRSSYQTGASTNITARPIQVEVRTTGSLDDLVPVVNRMVEAIDDVPGLQDVETTYAPGNPELQLQLLLDRAREYGLQNADMARTIRTMIDGDQAANFREEGEDFDIVVRLKPEDRENVADLRNLRLPLAGDLVPVTTIANVELSTSPTTIRRSNRQTEIVIGASNVGRNINEVQSDIQERISQLSLPAGVTVAYGGQTQEQQEGFQSLLLAMGLSVLFVYMVLASQFGSYLQPLIIMLAMPLSFIGAFLALTLTGTTLTVLAMIGFIMLLGLVTKNSILLVDFTNNRRKITDNLHDAIVGASLIRLRPILMTSLSVILGSVPAAIGLGEGAGLRRGLAIVVVGGMLTSTFLTLVLVPVAYSLTESGKLWVAHRREKRAARKQQSTRESQQQATGD